MPADSDCKECEGPYFATYRGKHFCQDCWDIFTFETGRREHDKPWVVQVVADARARVAARKAANSGT